MTASRRRDVLKAAGGLAVIGGLAGCSGGGDDEPIGQSEEEGQEAEEEEALQEDEYGGFRIAHASPDAPDVDVYFDDELAFEEVSFREISNYSDVVPDSYQIEITAAGDAENDVFDEEVEIEAGTTYTAVAFGEVSGGPEQEFEVEILEDDLTDPGEDMSRLRLFHASPDAPAVDVTVAEGGAEGAGNETAGNESENETGMGNETGNESENESDGGLLEDENESENESGMGNESENESDGGLLEDENESENETGMGNESDNETVGNETDAGAGAGTGEPLIEGLEYGDEETVEVAAGDYTLAIEPSQAVGAEGNETGMGNESENETGMGNESENETVGNDSEVGTEDNESGMGADDNESGMGNETGNESENESDGGLLEDENESENETGMGNETGNETGAGGEPVTEIDVSLEGGAVYTGIALGYIDPESAEVDEEFEVVRVEDAADGERSEGGTESGLFSILA